VLEPGIVAANQVAAQRRTDDVLQVRQVHMVGIAGVGQVAQRQAGEIDAAGKSVHCGRP
jgi:hypothetical protein